MFRVVYLGDTIIFEDNLRGRDNLSTIDKSPAPRSETFPSIIIEQGTNTRRIQVNTQKPNIPCAQTADVWPFYIAAYMFMTPKWVWSPGCTNHAGFTCNPSRIMLDANSSLKSILRYTSHIYMHVCILRHVVCKRYNKK